MIVRHRWVLVGAALTLLGLAMGALVADQFPHQYSGGTIRVRGWLLRLSWGLTSASMLGCACLAYGTRGIPRIGFGLAALTWLVHALLLGRFADQPLDPASGAVTALTVLVFLPSIFRALALTGWRYLILFATGDLVFAGFAWSQTPIEVLGRAHAAQGTGWMLVPAVVAFSGVAAMSLKRGASLP